MMNGGKIDVIGQMVDLIKAQGVPAGVGGHSLNMPMACEKNKLERRFLRQDVPHGPLLVGHAQGAAARNTTGCGATRRDHNANNDNMWCNNPEETAAFMETVEKPWVAFKVMAAGAIHAADGLPLRLPQRGRFRHRRHVRLPGRGRREDRHREPRQGRQPQAALAGLAPSPSGRGSG